MILLNKKYDQKEVAEMIMNFSQEFTPPLLQLSDIQYYIEKLSQHAYFARWIDNDRVCAFAAYYLNDVLQQLYISLIVVDSPHQRKGIGLKLVQELVAIANLRSYRSVALEVDKKNNSAYHFYVKLGFHKEEDRGRKLLMVKSL